MSWARSPDMKRLPYLLISLSVLVLDQWSKTLVVHRIPLGSGKALTPWFSIIHWQNAGGLFGFLDQLPPVWKTTVFLVLPVLGILLLGALFVKARRPWELILLSAILGGAAGNLVDRIRFGSVVDFLDVHWPGGPAWPTFNVADAFLSTGIILFLLLTFLKPQSEGESASDSLPHR